MTKPVLQALVLADHVYEDKATGKKIIAGTFNRLLIKTAPGPAATTPPAAPGNSPGAASGTGGHSSSGAHGPAGGGPAAGSPPAAGEKKPDTRTVVGGMHSGSPYCFISLTEVHVSCSLEFRYVDLSNNNVLLGTNIQVNCDDPLATVELVLPLPPLPTPHPGVYAMELLWSGEPLGSLRVTVQELAGNWPS